MKKSHWLSFSSGSRPSPFVNVAALWLCCFRSFKLPTHMTEEEKKKRGHSILRERGDRRERRKEKRMHEMCAREQKRNQFSRSQFLSLSLFHILKRTAPYTAFFFLPLLCKYTREIKSALRRCLFFFTLDLVRSSLCGPPVGMCRDAALPRSCQETDAKCVL